MNEDEVEIEEIEEDFIFRELEPFAEDDETKVAQLIEWIDALPSMEEIGEQLRMYEEELDEAGYEAYLLAVSMRAKTIYAYYEDIGEELQEKVTNRDKLLEMMSLWSEKTLEITDTISVYQINNYTNAVTTLVSGGSVREKLGGGMTFFYWDVIVAEADSNGQLYVAQYVTADEDKRDYKASTSDGFVLLLYNTKVNTTVGEQIYTDFEYKNENGYQSSGYGTLSFGTIDGNKPSKDNSDKLEIVSGADTRELIEVNLYDYNDSINDLYNGNKKYPGFQQDTGTQNTTSLHISAFNYGNNITADLAAGIKSVTRQGGSINEIENGANSPISGAVSEKLGSDGQPALADGTSLGYLFSNSGYAIKKNARSINGLFQYHEDTGAYTFNSRENHAQFNKDTDTFTLYKQIISSNFMMYPFGNFLPFNDIVHQSAQATTIDKAYLETIANSALKKSQDGAGTQYGTLSEQLKKFIALMDKQYPSGWDASDCTNEYFKVASIGKRFEKNDSQLQRVYSIDYDEPTDFYFGMEMKMKFMQPKSGLTGNDGKQPMVFYFTGDDDVWVYIDGKMFLDLSGIHRHVGGEIDFVNGVVKYYSLDKETGDVSTQPYKTVPFSKLVDSSLLNEKGTFKDYSTHSFNFYYMERGAGSGVCRMNFNFPLLRKNAVSVTKELNVDDGNSHLFGDPDFRFQILRASGDNITDELFIGAGREYMILDESGNQIGTGATDANGVFVLKAGQTALFNGISENAGKYLVRELLDTSVFEQYGNIAVDGSSQTTNYDVMVGEDEFKGVNSPIKDVSDGNTAFHFDNTVTRSKLGKLSIEKKLIAYEKTRDIKQFQFEVLLDGKPLPVGTSYVVGEEMRAVNEEGIIILAQGEKAVISDILAGTVFEVRELASSSDGYHVKYEVDGSESAPDEDGYASDKVLVGNVKQFTAINSELGVSIQIPIEKVLQSKDGKKHSYTIQLQQVTDMTGTVPVDPEIIQNKTVEITEHSVNDTFLLDYIERDIQTFPASYYYRIQEIKNPEETHTIFDETFYVVEVTVTQNSDGNLSAQITSVSKKGVSYDLAANENLVFTNRIQGYELPATGGNGRLPYAVGGLLCIMSVAAAGICRFRKITDK